MGTGGSRVLEAYTESWIRVLVLEMFLMILTKGRRVPLASRGDRPVMLLNTLQCRGQPHSKDKWPKMSAVLR